MRISRFAAKAAPTFALICLSISAGNAREFHFGAVDYPELLACDQLHWRGQLDESRPCYTALLQTELPPEVRAEAAWALKDLQLANRLFQQAVQQQPENANIRVRWGDLYADSHQDGEAMNIYREALGIDAANPFAKLGAASVLVGGFDDAANTYLQVLLTEEATDPGAQTAAWLLIARISLESSNLAQAEDALDNAAALIDEHGWPPTHLYALRAAADLLNNVEQSEWTERSLAYNPSYGGIYAIPAHFYVITRRYRDAIDLYQKAVDIDPGLASAHEELGVNLLRDNQMSRARRHLETAHDEDPFSPVAVNTLRLLDSFEDFRLVNDPDAPVPGVLPVTLRLHSDEAAVIAPYAIRLARDSIAEFTARYQFELKEPVVIEMYPDHEDFAVRTAGMPGIGILGATFGYVIAMDSPSGRPPDQYQWGTTLWHEMAHVFTLEATDHLVPRWFSEGVSVFEEWHSGPNRGVRIPMAVYNAMKDDKFLPISQLDEGFIRPTYEEQVIVSYMQAGLVIRFIAGHFGEDKLSALLDRYREGLLTPDAIEAVLDIPHSQFDKEFSAFVDAEHGEFLDQLEEWHRMQQVMGQRAAEADWDDVAKIAADMIELLPEYVEPDSPYLALAKAENERGNHEAALTTLEAFWRNGGFEPSSLKKLAGWLHDAARTDDAIAVYDSINLVDPLDIETHGMLGELLLAEGRAEDALQEFTVALALDPHDKASAYYRLASAHHALGDTEESQRQLLLALDVAPNYRPAQRLLLELARADAGSDHN